MCTLSTKIFCQIVYEKKNIQLWGLWCRRLSFRRTKQYCVLSRFQNTTKSLASHREHPTTCKYIVLLTTYRILSPIFWAKSAHLHWAKQAWKCANPFWIKTFGLLLLGALSKTENPIMCFETYGNQNMKILVLFWSSFIFLSLPKFKPNSKNYS